MAPSDPPRILLADDEALFAESTSELIRRHGYHCEHVSNATDALSRLVEGEFDVLISDINMPANDDLSLLKEIRKLESAPAVILVTGYPSVDTAVRSMEESVFAYKIKPFDIEQFLKTLDSAVRHQRFRHQVNAHTGSARTMLDRLEALQSSLEKPQLPDLEQTVMEYVSVLMMQVADTSMEVSSLLQQVNGTTDDPPLRSVSAHPDVDMLRNALRESVDVLEKTRNAFKSRELATLRKRLEQVLKLTT